MPYEGNNVSNPDGSDGSMPFAICAALGIASFDQWTVLDVLEIQLTQCELMPTAAIRQLLPTHDFIPIVMMDFGLGEVHYYLSFEDSDPAFVQHIGFAPGEIQKFPITPEDITQRGEERSTDDTPSV